MKPQCESATDRLIMRAVEERLAKLDELIAALNTVMVEGQAVTDAMAHRMFQLEHRVMLMEEAAEYWGLRKAPRDA